MSGDAHAAEEVAPDGEIVPLDEGMSAPDAGGGADAGGSRAGSGADAGTGASAPAGAAAARGVIERMARRSMGAGMLLVPALGAFAVSLALDVRALLPDVAFWDTAEFQAIGPVLGIAHPTGYPTYTLLAWVASVVLQPFGNAAYRADLLSALLVSGAAALTAVAVVLLTRRALIGLAAGVCLATAPLAWSLGVVADPHALHLFFAALLLVLLIVWMQRRRSASPTAGRWLFGASIVFGLALGNHALTVLLAPGIGIFVLLVDPWILVRRLRLVIACAAGLLVTTVLVYAYIPIRAAMNPPMDYADPVTLDRLKYLVLGQQFQGTFHALPSLSAGIGIVRDEVVKNLGSLAWLALAGAVLGTLRHAAVIALTGLWFALTFFFALGYENAAIERYYMVPIFIAVIWGALAVDAAWSGIAWAWSSWRERRSAADLPWPARAAVLGVAAAVLLVPVVAPVPSRFDDVDQSGNVAGRVWLDDTMKALPQNAVIISWWSFSTPLWYGRWVEGMRPDVTIIDDRTIIDQGYGDVEHAIEAFLGTRPVYLIRLPQDLSALVNEGYVVRQDLQIPAISGGAVYEVLSGPSGPG